MDEFPSTKIDGDVGWFTVDAEKEQIPWLKPVEVNAFCILQLLGCGSRYPDPRLVVAELDQAAAVESLLGGSASVAVGLADHGRGSADNLSPPIIIDGFRWRLGVVIIYRL